MIAKMFLHVLHMLGYVLHLNSQHGEYDVFMIFIIHINYLMIFLCIRATLTDLLIEIVGKVR